LVVLNNTLQQAFAYCQHNFIAINVTFFNGAATPNGSGHPHYKAFTITLSHTILDRTPLDE
jgi:hypothetical protein